MGEFWVPGASDDRYPIDDEGCPTLGEDIIDREVRLRLELIDIWHRPEGDERLLSPQLPVEESRVQDVLTCLCIETTEPHHPRRGLTGSEDRAIDDQPDERPPRTGRK